MMKGSICTKIGVIIHSHTGNTLQVGKRIYELLTGKGHDAAIERVAAENENPSAKNITLKEEPEVGKYDALIFGAPVWGFSLSTVMNLYLSRVGSLEGKKVGCFVTQKLSKPWLGGNRAVNQMAKLCMAKGAVVVETGVVNWSAKSRDSQIAELASRLAKIC